MRLLPILLLALAALPARAETAMPPLAGPSQNESCLECHGDDMEIELKSEEELNLGVDEEKFGHSVHGAKLGCVDCHADLKDAEDGHPKKRLDSARDFTVTYSKQCERCHGTEKELMQHGVHQAAREKGNAKAAVCADCHGAHEVAPPAKARTEIAKSCAGCHEKVADTFAHSVHGASLTGTNPDVPVCADCHRAHDSADPGSAAWKLSTPQICGKCHSDPARMEKYGLSTDVLKTYLSDFHGTTALLQGKEKDAIPAVAVCTDCHGVHDIKKADAPDSRVVKANLVETCRKCHPDATENFPAAWMSHQVPTLKRTPLVASVRIFYLLVIPFMVGGLILQIGMHLWRTVVKR